MYLVTKFRNKGAALLTACMLSIMSFAAAAQSTVGQTAATAIDGAKPQVELVQTALLGVIVLILVFGLIRKSFSK